MFQLELNLYAEYEGTKTIVIAGIIWFRLIRLIQNNVVGYSTFKCQNMCFFNKRVFSQNIEACVVKIH